jgi:hypothetical protein
MMFSKLKWFCNCCGKEKETIPHAAIGRKWRVCSMTCFREMEWRDTLSMLGKPYTPQPRTQLIENARKDGDHESADALQFDESGRCNLCEKSVKADRKHRCWSRSMAL